MKKPAPVEIEEEDSFTRAKAGFELFGEPLRPYSASRKVAAQSMGVLYPNIGDEGVAQFAKTNTWPGMLNDVICTLWLCTLPDPHEITADQLRAGAWTPIAAMRKRDEATTAALAWAEKAGVLDMNGEPFGEAAQIFLAIVQGVKAAEFAVVMEGGNGGETDSGKV